MILINLLPPAQRIRVAHQKRFFLLKNTVMIIFIFLIIYLLLFLSTKLYLDNKLSRIKNEVDNLQKSVPLDIEGSTNQIIIQLNNKIKSIDKIQDDYYKVSELLLNLIRIIPENITLNQLQINNETQDLSIEGTALTRDDLITLKDNFFGSEYLEDIQLPQEYLTQKTDINFKITGKIKTDKLIIGYEAE